MTKDSQKFEVPGIASRIIKTAHQLARADVDKERVCYLVSETEWQELTTYVSQFEPTMYLPTEKMTSMHFCGMEVIKRERT